MGSKTKILLDSVVGMIQRKTVTMTGQDYYRVSNPYWVRALYFDNADDAIDSLTNNVLKYGNNWLLHDWCN
jgi:hypothetical protein